MIAYHKWKWQAVCVFISSLVPVHHTNWSHKQGNKETENVNGENNNNDRKKTEKLNIVRVRAVWNLSAAVAQNFSAISMKQWFDLDKCN